MKKYIGGTRRDTLIIFILAFGLIVCCLVCVGCNSENVLSRIETYQAPPLPENEFEHFKMKKEPYDYLAKQRTTGAPTPTSLLICDVRNIMERFFSINVSNVEGVSKNEVMKALEFYLSNEWILIPGYRPWTHWNFVHSLKRREIKTLAQDLVEYMKNNATQLNCDLGKLPSQ